MQIVLLSTCVWEMVNLKTLYDLLDIVPNVELSIITYTNYEVFIYIHRLKGLRQKQPLRNWQISLVMSRERPAQRETFMTE